MATKTHDRADLRALRHKLDDIRAAADDTNDLFVRAMESFLTAVEYRDDTLRRSALEEAKGSLESSLTSHVESLAKHSAAAQAEVRDFNTRFEGVVVEPDQEFDDLGRSMSLLVQDVLGELVEFRGGTIVVASRHGMTLPNAAKLNEHIAYWEQVKADLVDLWPWSDAPVPLPPADREMIARSRAAIEAGEVGEDIDTLIARLRAE